MNLAFDLPWLLLLILPIGGWAFWQRHEFAHKELPDRLSAFFRLGVLAVAIIALAGPKIAIFTPKHYVIFAVDLSSSTGASQDPQALVKLIKQSAPADERTSYSVLTFGTKPVIETNFDRELKLNAFHTAPPTEGTDIAAVIRLALQTFPKDGTKEILLISDGRSSQGDLESALAQARALDVAIHTISMGMNNKQEYWVEQLRMPEEVALKLPFQTLIKLGATQKGEGQLLLYRGQDIILDKSITLEPGINTLDFQDSLDETGSYEYQVIFKPTQDQIAANNQLSAVVRATGGPQVLVIGASSEDNLSLRQLLNQMGYQIEEKSLQEFTPQLAALTSYKAVILNNIELKTLKSNDLEALKSYVRDIGGGLFVVQGQRALAELEDRSIEEILPVTYDAPQKNQIPGIALVLVLDRSSSMSEQAGDKSKIELLKLAATKGIEVLDPRDFAGIIAFDRDWEMIMSLSSTNNKDPFFTQIKRLRPGGGTDFYGALVQAFETLQAARTRIKHIMLFTDGKSDKDQPYEAFFQRLEESSITLSTVAIDTEPDLELLTKLARAGHGKQYTVRDANELPLISLKEIQRVSRLRWLPGSNNVQAGAASKLPKSLTTIPPIEGYALTYEKPTAEVWLTAGVSDPLLSAWRLGLGKVIVLNTDIEGQGSKNWLAWKEMTRLMGEVMAHIYRTNTEVGHMNVFTRLEGSRLEVTLDVQQNRQWEQGLQIEGMMSSTGKEPKSIGLTQIAPGRWRGFVDDLVPGSHVLRVSAHKDSQLVGEREKTVTMPYPEELRKIGLDESTLTKIAKETGGQYLETPTFQPHVGISAVVGYRELWSEVLLLALALFLLDLGLRKMPFKAE